MSRRVTPSGSYHLQVDAKDSHTKHMNKTQIMAGLKAHSDYNSDTIPPNWKYAEDHMLSRRIGEETKFDPPNKPNTCDCCGYQVEREPLPLSCDIGQLDFLGSGYPLFFNFMKYCCYILLIMIASSGAYNLISNYSGSDCKTLDFIKNNIICKQNANAVTPAARGGQKFFQYTNNLLNSKFNYDYATGFQANADATDAATTTKDASATTKDATTNTKDAATNAKDATTNTKDAATNTKDTTEARREKSAKVAAQKCTTNYVLHQAKVQKLCIKSYFTILSLGNKKDQPQELQQALNLLTIILVIAVLFRFRYVQRKVDIEADASNVSASDFAVCIKHIPHSIKGLDYDDLLKHFLRDHALENEKAKILKVVLAFDLSEFNRLTALKNSFIQRKQVLLNYQNFPNSFMNKIKRCRKQIPLDEAAFKAELQSTQQKIDETEKQLEDLQKKMQEGQTDYFCGTAFAYCLDEKEKSKIIENNVLETKHRFNQAFFNKHYSDDKKGLVMTIEKDGQKETRKLHCEEAAEPTDVFWENLAVKTRVKFFKRLVLQQMNVLFLVAAAWAIYELTMYQQSKVAEFEAEHDEEERAQKKKQVTLIGGGIAFAVVVINGILAQLVQILASSQNFTTRTKYYVSVASTSAIMQFANTALVSFLIQALKFQDYWGQTGLINAQSKILLMNILVPTIKAIIYPPYQIANFKRNAARKLEDKSTLTQAEAQLLYQHPEFQIQQEYAALIKTMLMTAMYAPIIPIGPIFSFFAIFFAYWYNKYNLLRRSQVSYQLGKDLSFEMTEMLEYILIIFAVSNAFWIHVTGHDIPITTYIGVALALLNSLLPIQDWNEKYFKIQVNHEEQNYYEAYLDFDTDYERSNPALAENAVKAHTEIVEKNDEKQIYNILSQKYPAN